MEVPFGATDAEVEQTIGTIHLRNQKNGRNSFPILFPIYKTQPV